MRARARVCVCVCVYLWRNYIHSRLQEAVAAAEKKKDACWAAVAALHGQRGKKGGDVEAAQKKALEADAAYCGLKAQKEHQEEQERARVAGTKAKK